MITPSASTTIGCRHPKARIEEATFSTADAGITLALFGYGVTRPIGHHSTANAGDCGLICLGLRMGDNLKGGDNLGKSGPVSKNQ